MRALVLISLILAHLGASALAQVQSWDEQRAYKYQHSFRQPFFLVAGTNLPYWDLGGSAVVSDDTLRLTPDEGSKKGFVWNTKATDFRDWEVEVEFAIGSQPRRGADGMAIWYAADRMVEGPVFGSQDVWRGLAVILDTFDNDGRRDEPAIHVIVNDGSRAYDHGSDGKLTEIGNCAAGFRYLPTEPTTGLPRHAWTKISYVDRTLRVFHDLSGNGDGDRAWTLCVEAQNVDLPSGYYFGASAATGGLSDTHDLFGFLTYSVNEDFGARQQDVNQQQQYQQQQQQAAVDPQKAAEQEKQQSEIEALRAKLKALDNLETQQQANTQQQEQDNVVEINNSAQEEQTQQQDDTVQQQQQQVQQQQQQQAKAQQQAQQQAQAKPQAQPKQQAQAKPQAQAQAKPQAQAQPKQQVQQPVRPVASVDTSALLARIASLEALVTSTAQAAQQQQKLFSEALSLVLGSMATKADLNDVARKSDVNIVSSGDNSGNNAAAARDLQRIVQSIKDEVNQLRAFIDNSVASEQRAIRSTLVGFNSNFQHVQSLLEGGKQETRQIVESQKRELAEMVGSSSSGWGIWAIIIVFQVFFAVAFIWWKRMRDEASKKYL